MYFPTETNKELSVRLTEIELKPSKVCLQKVLDLDKRNEVHSNKGCYSREASSYKLNRITGNSYNSSYSSYTSSLCTSLRNKHKRKSKRNEKLEEWVRTHENSKVPKLTELCYRTYLNHNKELLTSKYVTKSKYLTEVVRSTLLELNKRVCAICNCLHTEAAATLLHFTWVCLVPDVPLRYDFCSVQCARQFGKELAREKAIEDGKRQHRRERFGLGNNGGGQDSSFTTTNPS
ncbi:2888_t:CDS:2 [Diversispora eburnea]|uniref:2888_t:CDS:1 n=1 Tax=Diversispora eburnea TaxID=1213867 RepID=A0A9N8VJ82_9GLOM|nr:2888_t:CDS:2 [Diversispora eburnea]